MFGNLSIGPKTVGLLAVPVAAVTLLGATVATAGWGERSRAADDPRPGRLPGRRGRPRPHRRPGARPGRGVAAERLDRLALLRAEVDRRLATADQAMADHDRMVAGLLGVVLELARRLDGLAPAGTARLLLAVAAAKEATGRERSLLAATPATARPARAREEVLRARLTAAARTTETMVAITGPDPAGRWARPVPWTGCCAPP